jgi:GNAT superfamily N-acetyltransferase
VIIRRAAEADLPSIIALLNDDDIARSREGFEAEVTGQTRAAFTEIAADPNNELWVGELDGGLVATCQLTIIPGLSRSGMRRGLIEAVRVRADQRGKGLGATFMQRVIDRARERGCGLVQLTTDVRRTDAQRFYVKLGFEPSHVGMKLGLTK